MSILYIRYTHVDMYMNAHCQKSRKLALTRLTVIISMENIRAGGFDEDTFTFTLDVLPLFGFSQ